jgi:integrase
MGSIERVNRTKPWRARYNSPDGRRISKSFRRKADAEKWLLLEEGDVLAGRWHDPRSGTEVFSGYCEKWLEERSPTVARKTDYNTEAALRGRILPVFGNRTLKQITTKEIREWLTSLLAEGLSPATVKTYRQILGQVLNQAVADGILTTNPVDAVRTPTVRPRRQLFLNADELEMLADAAGEYGPLVWFLGWSGLRFGEAAALKVGNVDPARRRIRVEESVTDVGGRLVTGPPKTYETRTVIVPKFVIDRVAPLLEGKTKNDFVFAAPQGGPVRLNNFRRRVFASAASAIGKPDLVPHDLRDTAASLAISTGASIKAVQRMLGHASAAMTLDTYGSLFEEDLEALADRLQERYG